MKLQVSRPKLVQQSYQISSALMDGIAEEERLQRVYYNNASKQRSSPSSPSALLSLGSRRSGGRRERRGAGGGREETEGRRGRGREGERGEEGEGRRGRKVAEKTKEDVKQPGSLKDCKKQSSLFKLKHSTGTVIGEKDPLILRLSNPAVGDCKPP